MDAKVDLDRIYLPSEEIVARKIEEEIVLVPLTAGIGDMEDELFSLNETGRSIWDQLDGRRSLREIARELAGTYEGNPEEIEEDVAGLIAELLKRRMVVEVAGS